MDAVHGAPPLENSINLCNFTVSVVPHRYEIAVRLLGLCGTLSQAEAVCRMELYWYALAHGHQHPYLYMDERRLNIVVQCDTTLDRLGGTAANHSLIGRQGWSLDADHDHYFLIVSMCGNLRVHPLCVYNMGHEWNLVGNSEAYEGTGHWPLEEKPNAV
jgi:hypothetical protein